MTQVNKSTGSSIQYRRDMGLSTPNSVFTSTNSADQSDFSQIETAEVIDIILNSKHVDFLGNDDIGKVKIKLIGLEKSNDEVNLTWAWPINSYLISYPVKHEIVHVIKLLGRFFYYGSLNYDNNISNNSYPGISNSPVEDKSGTGTGYSNTSDTNIPKKEGKEDDLGDTFKDANDKIKPIEPSEGDVLLRGRFGQTIRLGNNPKTNLPNIKITVGQVPEVDSLNIGEVYIEDINNVPTSMWFLSNEKVDIQPITQGKAYHLKSVKDTPTYDGNQVIINTDGIIFNSKKNDQLFFSNKGMSFCTNGYIALDCYKDIGITTVNKLNIQAQNGMYIDSKEILLGKDAKEHMVLGDELVTWFKELLDELATETHPTGSGPSGPPVNSAKYKGLKIKLNKILSKTNRTI